MLLRVRKKRAVSEMIGYVLLISIAVIMSVIVYAWLKTYKPGTEVECPDSTSIAIEEALCVEGECLGTVADDYGCSSKIVGECSADIGCEIVISPEGIASCDEIPCFKRYKETDCYNPSGNGCSWNYFAEPRLFLKIKNSGLFEIDGFRIFATTSENEEIAGKDLSTKLIENPSASKEEGLIVIPNKLKTSGSVSEIATLYELDSQIFSVEIVPYRWQIEGNKKKFASCGDAKVREKIVCGAP